MNFVTIANPELSDLLNSNEHTSLDGFSAIEQSKKPFIVIVTGTNNPKAKGWVVANANKFPIAILDTKDNLIKDIPKTKIIKLPIKIDDMLTSFKLTPIRTKATIELNGTIKQVDEFQWNDDFDLELDEPDNDDIVLDSPSEILPDASTDQDNEPDTSIDDDLDIFYNDFESPDSSINNQTNDNLDPDTQETSVFEQPQTEIEPDFVQIDNIHALPETVAVQNKQEFDLIRQTKQTREQMDLCPLIIVTAGTGGITKSTTSALLAQRSSVLMHQNGNSDFRVILIDGNIKQDTQTHDLGLSDTSAPTVYEATVKLKRSLTKNTVRQLLKILLLSQIYLIPLDLKSGKRAYLP